MTCFEWEASEDTMAVFVYLRRWTWIAGFGSLLMRRGCVCGGWSGSGNCVCHNEAGIALLGACARREGAGALEVGATKKQQ